ncbi:MAG: EAL domain-containing protein [Thiohalobacteraceae bacterium]
MQPLKWINRLSFTRQIAGVFVTGIVLVYLTSSIAISLGSVRAVRSAILDEGRQIAETFANQSVLALLYHSPDNVSDAAEATLGFPDVKTVAIFGDEGELLASFGERLPEGIDAQGLPDGTALHTEAPGFFAFTAPVRFGEQLFRSTAEEPVPAGEPQTIGHVYLVVGKDRLAVLTRSIFGFNFVLSVVLAGALLVALLAVTRSVTHPVQTLSHLMRRAERGETGIRADAAGPCDVREMQYSFNTMMGVIEDRNRDLAASRDAALEVARLKGEFAANVSHELRTPLNSVLGMIELLRVSRTLPVGDRKYIDVAFASGNVLLDLINDILDFSKVETGHVQLHVEDFYLPNMIGDVIRLVSDQARRKQLDICYEFDARIPLSLRGDVRRLRQVVLNLVSNAVKFTADGSVLIRVGCEVHREDGPQLRVEVVDTGIGIPLHAHGRIFDAFEQADGSTTRRYGGTGLGLAICRQLVTLMGGRIGVMSFPGHGSTFWFSMPIVQAEDTRVVPDRASTAGIRVLAVSGIQRRAVLLGQIFQRWGSYFRTAASIEQAGLLLDEAADAGRAYDVLLVDLPAAAADQTAVNFLQQTQASGRAACIAMSDTTDVPPALAATDVGWLLRPLCEAALYDGVVHGLQRRSRPDGIDEALPEVLQLSANVLLVEDDAPSQLVARSMLERLGCRVVVANNGREALEMLDGRHFDLLLMDCQMPELDGYETTRRIRSSGGAHAAVPILAMTANATAGDREHCLAIGMNDHISKPLRLQVLAEKLRPWLPVAVSDTAARPIDHSLDHVIFDDIRAQLGATFGEYLAVFERDMARYIAMLAEQVQQPDPRTVMATAHTLRGSASTIGAVRLAGIAQSIESAARHGGAATLSADTAELRTALLEFSQMAAAVAATTEQDMPPATVLIVDEDHGTRLVLRKLMEADGCTVIESDNGADAVASCQESMPDLILMDAVMPGMDGFTACARIRAQAECAATPVLMITALDDTTAIEHALAAGATDYIPRPINFGLLRKRIARLLHAHRADRDRWRLANVDELTGLSNRQAFRETLAGMVLSAQDASADLAVLFLDLDRFKIANDSLGHDVGDLLIRAVGARILQCVQPDDLVARLGGDEFGVVLHNPTGRDMVAKVAGRLCQILAEPFTFLEKEVFLGASIGIAMYPQDGETLGELIKNADTAMYQAKADKGGRYNFYQSDMAHAVAARLDIERDLRRALDRDQFELYYQPQIDLDSGQVFAVEALIRWRHPDRGMVLPLEFIPIAEETGLIIPIGHWVLVQACAAAARLRRTLPDIRMAVNFCGKQLQQPGFVESVYAALKNSDLPAHALELEITESSLIDKSGSVATVIAEIKAAGISLSVDDFGTGYSSLSYLSRLPLDMVKIDRTFVRNLPDDTVNANLIKAIVAMTTSLGITVLAEGVETQAQVDALHAMGCTRMQGFHWARPLPFEELVRWFGARDGAEPRNILPFNRR